jgi:cytochrome c oxidase subunit 2
VRENTKLSIGVTAILALISPAVHAEYALNMPKGVTTLSGEIYNLHMLIFWICVAIGAVVYGVMLFSLIRHRKSVGHKASNFHESIVVELIWTIIPVFILIGMAIPATKVLKQMEDPSNSEISIKITGHRWFWHYEYLNEKKDENNNIAFYSRLSTPQDEILNRAPKGENYLIEVDKHVVIPIDTKVRFLTTSADVIHSWWVPEMAVKKDAIPGFINETWAIVTKPGIYRGQCTELCGKDHGYMPIVVEALTKEDYQKWLAAQKAPKA